MVIRGDSYDGVAGPGQRLRSVRGGSEPRVGFVDGRIGEGFCANRETIAVFCLDIVLTDEEGGIVVASEEEDIGRFEAKVRSFMELELISKPSLGSISWACLMFWDPPPSSGRNERTLKKEREKVVEEGSMRFY